jgi:hypothetical protein
MPSGVYKRNKPIWNKGKTGIYSKKALLKMSLAKMGKYVDEKSWYWKGNNVGYVALHMWVKKHLGNPKKCEHCGKKNLRPRQYNWANIDHKYRRKLEDWIRLCVKCHRKYDKEQNAKKFIN